jgi:hypothetical protein
MRWLATPAVVVATACTWIADFPDATPTDTGVDGAPDGDVDADVEPDGDADGDADGDPDPDADPDVVVDADSQSQLNCHETASCVLDCSLAMDCINGCMARVCERDAEIWQEVMSCAFGCSVCLEGIDTECWACVVTRCPDAAQDCLGAPPCT